MLTLYQKFLKALRLNDPGKLMLVSDGNGALVAFEPDCWLIGNLFNQTPVMIDGQRQITICQEQLALIQNSYSVHVVE